jgi:hypothetical protein
MQNSGQWASWQYKGKNQAGHYKKRIDMCPTKIGMHGWVGHEINPRHYMFT